MPKKTIEPVGELANFNMSNSIKKQRTSEKKNEEGKVQTSEKEKEQKQKQQQVDAAPSNLPELPKNFQDKFFDNIFSYDRSPDKGRPVYISSKLLDKLQDLSERHYKRLTMRTIVQSVLATFLSYDTDKAVDVFLDKINFQVPTTEELEAKKTAAEKARERRASEK